MRWFVRAAAIVLALAPAARAGGVCNTGQAYSYGHQNYVQSYAAPTYYPAYQTYYTPVVKELQYIVTAPAYGDYGAGTQYGGEQLRAKIRAEVQAEEQVKRQAQELAEIKALLLQQQARSAPAQVQLQPVQVQPATWSGPAPVQQIPNWSGPAPVQQLQLPQKVTPAPSSQGWPTSQSPTYPAPQPPLSPVPGGAGAAAVVPPDQQTLQVLEAKCSKCHNPQTARGSFVLFAGPGTLAATLTPGDVVTVEQKVGDGEMPPPETGVSVSNEEFSGIKAWRQANAAAITAMLRQRR